MGWGVIESAFELHLADLIISFCSGKITSKILRASLARFWGMCSAS